jgi:hypothetical protein
MGPDILGGRTRAIFFRLKEGDEVDVAVIVSGVGNTVGTVIVEVAPDRRTIGTLGYRSQHTEEQLTEPADGSGGTRSQNPDPIAAVFVIGVG